MTSSNPDQTIALDDMPEVALDSFPDTLQRVALGDVGLDGITDMMVVDLDADPFDDQTRGSGVWSKVA